MKVAIEIFTPTAPAGETFQYECDAFDVAEVIKGLLLIDGYKEFTEISITPVEEETPD